LHHLLEREDRLQALREIKRVTRNQAFITVWNRENPELPDKKVIEKKWADQTRIYYLYDKEELKNEIAEAGLSARVWSEERNIFALIRPTEQPS
ncbi:MAG: hypothetical protein JSV92_05110, partial [archaeon]